MKQFLAFVVLLTALSAPTFAQGTSGGKNTPNQAPPLVVIKTVTGTVKTNGDELTLVDDADGKPWNIINPDAVRKYEGQHVQITGHAFTNKRALHAHTVELVKDHETQKQ